MANRHGVNSWLKSIQQLFYPARCLLCGAPASVGRDLCSDCYNELPHNPHACALCALPLTRNTGVCGGCLRRPPPLDGSTIPFRYAAPLDQLLLGLKFNQRLVNARLLGGLLADAVTALESPLPDCILPVPLHPERLRERGYNQALELARPVAQRLGLPLATGLVIRERSTAAQSSLDQQERRRNIRGAFTLIGQPPDHIAVLDDVVTTGSTVNELARALRRGGTKRVEVWACARVD